MNEAPRVSFERDGGWADGMTGSVDVRQAAMVDAVEPPTRKPRRRWLAWSIAVVALFLILWLLWTAPLSRALEPLPQPTLVLLSAEGQPIARKGALKEEPVDVSELPKHVPDAFVAIEDRRFHGHIGIDPKGIARAAWRNLRAGGVREGGSTITQQLAKTAFLSGDRSFRRKGQELLIAFWLEAWLSKDEILSRYLSSIYFGDGVYGLRAASRHYFSREPERLTRAQAAMLAGMVKAPSRLAPTRDLEAAQKRSRLVIAAMVDTGKLDKRRAARFRPARLAVSGRKLPTGTYFADWVSAQAQDAFEADYGEIPVRTTLEADLQKIAVRAIGRAGLGDAQAALVAMRPDGRVVAMVGGRSYGDSPFNRATQARRQPGSAFKLFVYYTALSRGYGPDSLIDGSPLTIDGWSPKNNDGRYRDSITLRRAFASSSNVAAVRLSEAVGRDNVIRTARQFGVRSPLASHPSIALGTSGMTLLELTQAYAGVANGRYPVRARGLPKEEPGWRERLRTRSMPRRTLRADMLDLLWSAANEGTGRAAALGTPTFGKTGTTQDHRDALFVGFAGDLVVAVWVGNDDNSPMEGVTGGGMPARIWRDFMRQALATEPGRTSDIAPPARARREPAAKPADEAVDPIDMAGDALSTVEDLVGEGRIPEIDEAQRAIRAVDDLRDRAGAIDLGGPSEPTAEPAREAE